MIWVLVLVILALMGGGTYTKTWWMVQTGFAIWAIAFIWTGVAFSTSLDAYNRKYGK